MPECFFRTEISILKFVCLKQNNTKVRTDISILFYEGRFLICYLLCKPDVLRRNCTAMLVFFTLRVEFQFAYMSGFMFDEKQIINLYIDFLY